MNLTWKHTAVCHQRRNVVFYKHDVGTKQSFVVHHKRNEQKMIQSVSCWSTWRSLVWILQVPVVCLSPF